MRGFVRLDTGVGVIVGCAEATSGPLPTPRGGGQYGRWATSGVRGPREAWPR